MAYLDPALVEDETSIAEAILAALADWLGTEDLPWEASEAHVEVAQAEALALVLSTIVTLILSQEAEDYSGFGANVVELERDPATVAEVDAVFTLTTAATAAGATIAAGYTLVLAAADGTEHPFTLPADLVIAPAAGSGTATLQAQESGPDPNGATGDEGIPVAYDDLAVLATVEVTDLAAGGADEQDLTSYNTEVVRRARRVRALPITPEDYAAHLLDDGPLVGRALAVNRTDPDNPGDQPGHVTIYTLKPTAVPPDSGELDDQQEFLDALETVRGTTAHAAAFGTVDVAVVVQFQKADGYSDSEAQAAVKTKVETAFTRLTWNYDPEAAGLITPVRAEVTRYDISAAVDDLPQVVRIISVTLDGGAGPIAVPATSVMRATPVTATAI